MTYTAANSKAGTAAFAHAMLEHVQRHYGAEWGMSEGTVGRIRADGWLIVDGNFRGVQAKPIAYPPDEFYILRYLRMPVDFVSINPDAAHHTWLPTYAGDADTAPKLDGGAPPKDGQHPGHTTGDGSHTHQIQTPPQLRPPMPGDKVAVLWLDQRVPCVLGVMETGRALYPGGDGTYVTFAGESWNPE